MDSQFDITQALGGSCAASQSMDSVYSDSRWCYTGVQELTQVARQKAGPGSPHTGDSWTK